MGSNSASGGGGGRTDAGPNRTTATKIGVGNITESGKKTKSYKSDNPNAFRNVGAEKIKKGVNTPSLAVNATAALLSTPLQAGSKVTRDFFTDKVLGSKNYKNVSKTEFLSYNSKKQEMMYKSYMDKRMSGQTDAYGNTIQRNDNDGGGNQVVTAPTEVIAQAPTNAEVSQSEATDASSMDTSDPTYVKRKNKRKGRSPTILTGVTGATGGLTLGKKSLLGIS